MSEWGERFDNYHCKRHGEHSCQSCLSYTINDLRAHAARLEGEVERLRQARDHYFLLCASETSRAQDAESRAARLEGEVAKWEASADDLLNEREGLLARAARLEERLAGARAVLREVEWGNHSYGRLWCPACSGTPGTGQSHGHAPDCALAAALGEGEP